MMVEDAGKEGDLRRPARNADRRADASPRSGPKVGEIGNLPNLILDRAGSLPSTKLLRPSWPDANRSTAIKGAEVSAASRRATPMPLSPCSCIVSRITHPAEDPLPLKRHDGGSRR